MSANYWPWWLGGPLLAVVAVLFPLLAKAPLGVSGALGRFLRWRQEGRPGEARPGAPAGRDPAAPLGRRPVECGGGVGGGEAAQDEASVAVIPVSRAGRVANLVFLLAISLGGGLAGWVGGRPWGSLACGTEFERIFGAGAGGWAVLFVGGVLVGFGTRLSGGCTSGHGLTGCGRLQPASLLATALFFGVAIGVTFLLQALRP